jgi:hypothetical protein
MLAESLTCSVCQAAVDKNELEISTPAKVQVNHQRETLDFQRFTPRYAVKIVTFAANWQILDGMRHHC